MRRRPTSARRLAIAALTVLLAATCGEEPAPTSDAGTASLPTDGSVVSNDSALAGDDVGDTETAATDDSGSSGGSVDTGGGPCTKDCKDKICGPDGCGGVCGFCVTGQFCAKDGAKCEEFCKPNCKFADGGDKKCGEDGCGGSCGSCPADFSCGVDFLCHSKDCKPACGAKSCGDDGCGGLCGTCATGDLCQPDGSCKPGPCKGIPTEGACDGDILIGCEGDGPSASKSLVDCKSKGVEKICGWDGPSSTYGCIDKPPCTADCSTKDGGKKQCGSDGCDGQCGVCPSGWSCPGGTCNPEDGGDCGFLPAQGQCDGNTWIFCNTGKIKKIDCGKYNQTCGYDGKAFTCK